MSEIYYIGLGKAAKATGKQPSTILKALNDKRLPGEKNAQGKWKMLKGEVHKIWPEISLNSEKTFTSENNAISSELIELRVKVKALEEKNELLQIERNDWHQQAERVSHLLTDQREKETPSTQNSGLLGGLKNILWGNGHK